MFSRNHRFIKLYTSKKKKKKKKTHTAQLAPGHTQKEADLIDARGEVLLALEELRIRVVDVANSPLLACMQEVGHNRKHAEEEAELPRTKIDSLHSEAVGVTLRWSSSVHGGAETDHARRLVSDSIGPVDDGQRDPGE